MGDYPTRIDPDTGVPVLTTAGFVQSMADHDGTTFEEAWDNTFGAMYREMENDSRNREAEMLANPLAVLLDAMRGDETEGPWPEEVLQVLKVEAGGDMGGSSERMHALVRCVDGNLRFAEYTRSETYGSRMEPPDGDCEVAFMPLDTPFYLLDRLARFGKLMHSHIVVNINHRTGPDSSEWNTAMGAQSFANHVTYEVYSEGERRERLAGETDTRAVQYMHGFDPDDDNAA